MSGPYFPTPDGDEPIDWNQPIERIPPYAVCIDPDSRVTATYGASRHCKDCDVKWTGEPECWMCGVSVERAA